MKVFERSLAAAVAAMIVFSNFCFAGTQSLLGNINTVNAAYIAPEEKYGDYLSYREIRYDDASYFGETSYNNHIVITNCDESAVSVEIPSKIGRVNVTTIGYNAFKDCINLTNVVIPDGITHIEGYAFSGCTGLTSIKIPDSVISINRYAFSDCTNLINVEMPDSIKYMDESVFSGTPFLENQTGVKYSGEIVVDCDKDLVKAEIKPGTKVIADNAFKDCTALTSVIIPDSVTSIGTSAFENCTGLSEITIPDSITSIGTSAFKDCTGLSSIIIPNGVTTIGYRAFYGCTGLTNIKIPYSVTEIGDEAFRDTPLLENQSDVIKYVGNWLIECDKEVTEVEIKFNIKGIADSAFSGCTGLTGITIPSGVTSIGMSAFSSCESLAEITIPYSVRSIGWSAFSSCTGLKSITIESFDCEINKSPYTISNKDYTDNCYDGVIRGYKGSTAQEYADLYRYEFEVIEPFLFPELPTTTEATTTTTTEATTEATTTTTETTTTTATEATTEATTTTTEATTTTATEATTETTTTTTATETTTMTTEAATTIVTTAAPVSTTVVTSYFATKEKICSMAIQDYKKKTGETAAKAESIENEDGTLSIILSDKDGITLDTYVIDPITGTGTSVSSGNEVNLPQTGNNSLKTVAAASSALILTIMGAFAVIKSGVIRKKEDFE